ncbi:MAG: hypothetical protein ACI4JB_07370, partial [Porcipelethomonas sp.]
QSYITFSLINFSFQRKIVFSLLLFISLHAQGNEPKKCTSFFFSPKRKNLDQKEKTGFLLLLNFSFPSRRQCSPLTFDAASGCPGTERQ